MKIKSSTVFAIKAIQYLANEKDFIKSFTIIKDLNLCSVSFGEKLLWSLQKKGILVSKRGDGYMLRKKEVSFLEIVKAMGDFEKTGIDSLDSSLESLFKDTVIVRNDFKQLSFGECL